MLVEGQTPRPPRAKRVAAPPEPKGFPRGDSRPRMSGRVKLDCSTTSALCETQRMKVEIKLEPIARVETARTEVKDDYWGGAESHIVLEPQFEPEALLGIEEFSHAEIIFFFDRIDESTIVTGARRPRNNPNWPVVGIFAQRGKNRPNRIGSTICRVLRREGRVLVVSELDAIDGTPVLDIKPLIVEFLPRAEVRQPKWSHELMQDYWKKPD